jgi:hypothetical protein
MIAPEPTAGKGLLARQNAYRRPGSAARAMTPAEDATFFAGRNHAFVK